MATGRRPFTTAPPPSLQDVTTAWELNDRVLAWVDKRLREGPAGHKHIVRTPSTFEEEDLKGIDFEFSDFERLHFLWLRFAVRREHRLTDFAETMYRTAAENPGWFRERDQWVFELLSDETAAVLPWIVEPGRLERFREYAERILDVPPAEMNPVLRDVRDEIEQNLQKWIVPPTEVEILDLIRSPELSDARRLRLIHRVADDQLGGVDVVGLVANRLRVGDVVEIDLLGRLALTRADLARLDDAFRAGIETDPDGASTIEQFLHCTNREKWHQMRGFVDEGFRRNGIVALSVARALSYMDVRVPESYIRSVLDSGKFPRDVRVRLRIKFIVEK